MKDFERKLVIIALFIVGAIFTLLLFNSCRTKKQAVNVNTQAIIEQTTKTDTHTTDNSKIDEDFTEITYILDSGQVVNITDKFGNSEQPLLKVLQIKVKTSHVTHENNIDSKIYAEETKTAEIKEKTQTIEKEKPNTTRNLRLVAVLFISIVVLLALWRFYQKLN